MATFTDKRNGVPEQNFTGTVWVNMNVLLPSIQVTYPIEVHKLLLGIFILSN